MPVNTVGERILAYLQEREEDLVAYISRLVLAESPSSDPAAQTGIQSILRESLTALDCDVQIIAGVRTGGHLLAKRVGGEYKGKQLLLGHCDTVWPTGTLEKMPLLVEEGKMKGPGVYDMKAGLAMMVFARGLAKMVSGQQKVATAKTFPDGETITYDLPRIYELIDSKIFGNFLPVVTIIFLVCVGVTWVVLSIKISHIILIMQRVSYYRNELHFYYRLYM